MVTCPPIGRQEIRNYYHSEGAVILILISIVVDVDFKGSRIQKNVCPSITLEQRIFCFMSSILTKP